jgi:protein-S-isoprenylcysteine O-methyltransferase Ste14
MELTPALGIGLLNGWILLAVEFLIEGGLLLVFPRDVVSRLFDRSGWSTKQRVFTILGKVFSLACLLLIVLTPLRINPGLFIVGVVLYVIGLVGLVLAMSNYKDTPLDQPVSKGVYMFSRHPQIVAVTIVFVGICLAIGSWLALFTLLMSRGLQHFGILAEEEICLKRYGESYRAYMENVPRYFLFF